MSDFDDWYEEAVNEGMTFEQRQIIGNLIEEIHLDDNQLKKVQLFLCQSPSAQEAEQMIHWIYSLRPDPINSGHNYQQTDIQNKLRDEIG